MRPAPTPQNTIVISLGWMITGAMVATATYRLMPLIAPDLVRQSEFSEFLAYLVAYIPILILNGIAYIVASFELRRSSKPRNHLKTEIFVSSLFGVLIGALVLRVVSAIF